MNEFGTHPMTCGKCGRVVTSRKCWECGHDEVPISEQLAAHATDIDRLMQVLRETEKRLAAAEALLKQACDKKYLDDEGNECEHVTSRWLNEAKGGA